MQIFPSLRGNGFSHNEAIYHAVIASEQSERGKTSLRLFSKETSLRSFAGFASKTRNDRGGHIESSLREFDLSNSWQSIQVLLPFSTLMLFYFTFVDCQDLTLSSLAMTAL